MTLVKVYSSWLDRFRAYLTTDSPMSSYGIPVVRVEMKEGEWPDLGPLDMLPNGMLAGDLIQAAIRGYLEPGIEGELYPLSGDGEVLADRFIDLWLRISPPIESVEEDN